MKFKPSIFLIISFVTILILTHHTYAQKSITAFRIKEPIIIDGIFEPEKWMSADSAAQFIQMEPEPNKMATEKTIGYFGFDDQNIYAVIKCYQSSPVIAKNQSRDALTKNDDIVALLIDTYNDSRRGYVFFSNPRGTQIDMAVNDDGKSLDINWDTEWKCQSKIFEWGWCAEFQIPFQSIKYKKGIETWGVNFGRVIRSNFETDYWSEALIEDFRISQSGELNGIQTPGSRMQLSIFPYLSIFKTTGEKLKIDAGGDIRWQINPNISLNGTIYPDFSTVEADQQKINLTRYELSYPEKRLFFQEGNEMYNTRFQTFYSRRIQDIDFGERLNGKIGKTQFNILNVKTQGISDQNPALIFTAARAKYDFLKSSNIGITLVDKSYNGGFTRSVSLDYVLNIGKTYLTGQFVGSAPGDFKSHSAWFMRFARENNIYHYHFRYNNVGENFRDNVNQTGFITDDDRKEIDLEGTYKFWLKNNILKYIEVGSNDNIFWSHAGILRSWDSENSVNFYLNNRFNFEYSYNNEYKLFEKEFHNYSNNYSIGYNTEEWSHATVSFTSGKNFDRKFTLLTSGTQIKMLKNLSLAYSLNVLNFKPDPENSSTLINVLTVNYNFTKDLWIKMFAQNSTAVDLFYFYGMFGWRFKPPFGALYLIYSHDETRQTGNCNLTDSFFLKLTYPISIL
jgi:hypothetical protein